MLADNAKVNPAAYQHLNDYRERVLNRPLIRELIESDRVKDKEMAQQIIPDV